MVEVITQRLTIRKATREEIKQISNQNNANRSSAYLAGLSKEDRDIIFRDSDAVTDLLARLAAVVGDGAAVSYGAWFGAEMIGYITLNNCNAEMPDLQIELAPTYHGQGFGFEFLSELLDYLFATGYTCFRYAVMPNNAASIALVEKVGGILQAPESEAEGLLLKTYHIMKP